MKRNLAEYSSDFDWSSPPLEENITLPPADKRERSEEVTIPGCSRSSSILSDVDPKFAISVTQSEVLTRVTTPDEQSYLLNADQLRPSALSSDPSFYEHSTFHFDFTTLPSGRKHFEQWAASLGDELARHVRRLKFTVVGPPGYQAETPLEIPHDVEVLVQRGGLTCNEPDPVLRKKLAHVDEHCVGAGFGVNGLIAIGRVIF